MSGTINAKKSSFVVFGSGFDLVRDNSGTGDPYLVGTWFKYDTLRRMEEFGIPIPTSNAEVDRSSITFTDSECYFAIPPLPKTGILPTFAEVKTFVESITSKDGGESYDHNITDLLPVSKTDSNPILGLVAFYQNKSDIGNDYYKYGHWCVYNESVGHWTMIGGLGDNFSLSYTIGDVADDETMRFTIIRDDYDHVRISKYHPSNPERKTWVGQRLTLSDYTFWGE